MNSENKEQKGQDSWMGLLKQRIKELKRQIYVVYLAMQDMRTPWFVKLLAMIVVGYALSPIDLVPDFIPVLGYLDDFILIPLGVYLIIRLIPQEIWVDCEQKARVNPPGAKPRNWVAAALIVLIWILAAVYVWSLIAK